VIEYFEGADGARLAYREFGDGRPLVLFHGFLSSADANWVRGGHAELLAARGHRVILPDLRAHGESAKPHDAAAYPADVVAEDGLALIEQLGLDEYDLGGYSLGARTTIRLLARGAAPRRAVIAGMGLDALVRTASRGDIYRRVLSNPGGFGPGTREARTDAYVESIGADPVALLHLLETIVETPPEAVAAIATPALVLCGEADPEFSDAAELATVLGDARFGAIPGNHTSAIAKPELGAAIAEFLAREED
jgi:pimeloyl-ACP methyl ester carboxylesterase